jgi:hypothetical protein
LLVVLAPEGMNKLPGALAIAKSWRKRHVAVPLMMTKAFIETSMDCYPIEFLNMKNSHILIYGENILSNLDFQPADLRLQIERELKGKLVLLRQRYLESEGKTKQLRQLIHNSITAFISIFNALLYLKQVNVPHGRRDTIKETARLLVFDAGIFLQCADIKEGINNFPAKEIEIIFQKYIQEVEKICNIVDKL